MLYLALKLTDVKPNMGDLAVHMGLKPATAYSLHPPPTTLADALQAMALEQANEATQGRV